jgi:hypothetical protein
MILAADVAARADFSYSLTTKTSGGMMSGAGGDRVTKHYLKDNKLKIDHGDTATILDFDAQTVTNVSNTRKTYTVMKFDELTGKMGQSGAEITVDVKETGQRKNVNGFDAREVILSMDMDSPQARQAGMKMRMEMDMWISPDVPGASEVRAFYQKNGDRFPWAAMAGSGRGDQGMQKGVAELQRKMAGMNGVPVLQVMRMKTVGNDAQMQQAQQSMTKACAQLEALKAKGGQQATMAEQMLQRMNCKGSGSAGGGTLFEATIESSNFSTAAVPDSTFAIPQGFKQVDAN